MPLSDHRTAGQVRRQAINSPATRVPSHGIQAYGQTYAVDLVHEPVGQERQSGAR